MQFRIHPSACGLRAFTTATWVRIFALALPLSAGSNALAQTTHRLISPDKRVQITLETPVPGSRERPRWSATFLGKPVLTGCRLGLQTADAGDLLAGVRVVRARE